MFDICFEDGDPVLYDDEDDKLGLVGRTVLGDFTERFVAPLGWWNRLRYERQWVEGAERLLDAFATSAFVLAPARLWWIAERRDDLIAIRQQFLGIAGPPMVTVAAADGWLNQDVPYDMVSFVPPADEDGRPISEWLISLQDVREFVERNGHAEPRRRA